MENQGSWWSWSDFVNRARSFGVPHFQRGQVWEAGNRAALVESILEGSPCGSLVLWSPIKPGLQLNDIGISLVCRSPAEETHWLIDGQQRTRALLGLYWEVSAFGQSVVRLLPDAAISALVGKVGGWDVPPVLHVEVRSDPEILPDDDKSGEERDEVSSVGREGDRCWYVSIPKLLPPADAVAEDGVMGNWAKDSRIQRSPVLRTFSGISIGRKVRPTILPPGLVPLGLFLEERPDSGWQDLWMQLRTLVVARDFDRLRDLCPWGPGFVTGHVMWSWERTLESNSDQATNAFDWLANRGSMRLRKVTGIFARKVFAVGFFPESSTSRGAIDAYVRINRAGVRVQAEERALATLSGWSDAIMPELRKFMEMRDIGRIPQQSQIDEHSRRWLVHEADKAMGFALWAQVVARTLIVDVAIRGGVERDNLLAWFAADDVERSSVTTVVGVLSPDDRGKLLLRCASGASRTLRALDSVLSDELLLDHRMARPDSHSLKPFVDIFAHGLARDDISLLTSIEQRDPRVRFLISHALLWAMLHSYLDKAEMQAVAKGIAHGESSPDRLEGFIRQLFKLWCVERKEYAPQELSLAEVVARIIKWALEAFSTDVNDARSLQHRAVGWLYALERRSGCAREFDWRAQVDGDAIPKDKRNNLAEPLRACWPKLPDAVHLHELHPEKQHIVPFTDATKIVGKGGTRATASPANGVGNLTWLSQRQNGFVGFNRNWLVPSVAVDVENFIARGFGDGGPGTALQKYSELWDVRASSLGAVQDHLAAFQEFTKLRREWMIQQMKVWLDEAVTEDRWVREFEAWRLSTGTR